MQKRRHSFNGHNQARCEIFLAMFLIAGIFKCPCCRGSDAPLIAVCLHTFLITCIVKSAVQTTCPSRLLANTDLLISVPSKFTFKYNLRNTLRTTCHSRPQMACPLSDLISQVSLSLIICRGSFSLRAQALSVHAHILHCADTYLMIHDNRLMTHVYTSPILATLLYYILKIPYYVQAIFKSSRQNNAIFLGLPMCNPPQFDSLVV